MYAYNTLTFVNNSIDRLTKNFIFDTENDVYTVAQNLGTTKNTVSIKGVRNNDKLSTIDLNNKSGFELSENNSKLNISNTKLINANATQGSVINLTNERQIFSAFCFSACRMGFG